MSDYLPIEIQEKIIKNVLPVKSLLRFRSVSKQWKSFIDSSEFIAHHHHLVNHTQPDHILIRYNSEPHSEYKYFSRVDDDVTFPQKQSPLIITPAVSLIKFTRIFDASHGLVCLYASVVDGNNVVVLWNPSIGKSVTIELPRGSRAFGFGVCPKTLDPKILKATAPSVENGNGAVDWQVELFTLSSGGSRSISTNVPMDLVAFNPVLTVGPQQKVIDGVIYWKARSLHHDGDAIVSFDLTAEEFGEVELPGNLARRHEQVVISKIKGSLAVLDIDMYESVCDVWMLRKTGVEKLFTVSFDKYGYHHRINIIGFRKNGELIRKYRCRSDASLNTLEAYEPSTKRSIDLGTHVACRYSNFFSYMMTSYSESLLLVNHTETIIQG